MRAAVPDVAMHANQRRALSSAIAALDRARRAPRDRSHPRRPAYAIRKLEAPVHVFGKGEVGLTVDGDVIAVVEINDIAEAEMPRDRRRLAGDAFHQIAVAADRENSMVEQVRRPVIEARRHVLGRDRHPDAIADALAQRPGRGLDADRDAVLGMTGRLAAELAEALDLVERQIVAAQMERGVEQHRAMAGREHETVAAIPLGVLGVVAHEAREEEISDGRHPHRHAGMPGVGFLHGVDREHADRVNAELIEVGL